MINTVPLRTLWMKLNDQVYEEIPNHNNNIMEKEKEKDVKNAKLFEL